MKHRPTSTRGQPGALQEEAALPLAERLFLLLEDPSHFRRYLSRLDPESRVGEPADGRSCPLARFLNTMAGAPTPLEIGEERVFLMGYRDKDTLPVAPLPYWAQTFIRAVDAPTDVVVIADRLAYAPRSPHPRLTASAVSRILSRSLIEGLLYQPFTTRTSGMRKGSNKHRQRQQPLTLSPDRR